MNITPSSSPSQFCQETTQNTKLIFHRFALSGNSRDSRHDHAGQNQVQGISRPGIEGEGEEQLRTGAEWNLPPGANKAHTQNTARWRNRNPGGRAGHRDGGLTARDSFHRAGHGVINISCARGGEGQLDDVALHAHIRAAVRFLNWLGRLHVQEAPCDILARVRTLREENFSAKFFYRKTVPSSREGSPGRSSSSGKLSLTEAAGQRQEISAH